MVENIEISTGGGWSVKSRGRPVKLLRSPDDIVAALRARKEALNISNEALDAISLLPDGYVSKLLAPRRMKHLGELSLPSLLEALGVALVLVPDPDAIKRVEGKWAPRKRPQRLPEPDPSD